MASTALVAPESSVEHLTPHGHPERPERFSAVMGALASTGLDARMKRLTSNATDRETILLCHGADYIRTVERDIAAGSPHLSTGDTHLSPQSLEVALEAVGAVAAAVDAIAGGEQKNAFCALRPPGHHARPDQGMGFCIFNNVAIGARHAIRRRGLERVLIVDWDVHGVNPKSETDESGTIFSEWKRSPR